MAGFGDELLDFITGTTCYSIPVALVVVLGKVVTGSHSSATAAAFLQGLAKKVKATCVMDT